VDRDIPGARYVEHNRMSVARRRLLVLEKHFAQGHGGAPESTLALSRLLALAGTSVDVLTDAGVVHEVGERLTLPRSPEGRHEPINWSRYQALLVVGAWIPRALPAVVEARRHRKSVTYAPRGALARIEFRRPRDIKKVPYLFAVEFPVLRMAHRVLFSSRIEADACVIPSWLAPEIEVLPDPYFRPSSITGSRTLDAVRYGFIAELSPRKGLRELARGFVLALTRDPGLNIELHLAGAPRPGSERYVAEVRRELASVEDRVIWYGAVRGREREDFYASVDCIVVPSRFESYGLTPLEAVARELPAIVSPTLGVLEYLDPSVAIHVLPAVTPRAIAAAVSDVDRVTAAVNAASSSSANKLAQLTGLGLATRYSELLFGRTGPADRRVPPYAR
jgi:glycosyltransferase involved in cell wall biosynthesis